MKITTTKLQTLQPLFINIYHLLHEQKQTNTVTKEHEKHEHIHCSCYGYSLSYMRMLNVKFVIRNTETVDEF
jgi:hypothetical protein